MTRVTPYARLKGRYDELEANYVNLTNDYKLLQDENNYLRRIKNDFAATNAALTAEYATHSSYKRVVGAVVWAAREAASRLQAPWWRRDTDYIRNLLDDALTQHDNLLLEQTDQ